MSKKNVSRREFIKSTSITGITSAAAISGLPGISSGRKKNTDIRKTAVKVPTRIFGKTKVPVSILSLGGMLDTMGNQAVLKKALDLGVTCWDTSDDYGNSEPGIGMFFEKFPKSRKNVFLITKTTYEANMNGMTRSLNRSLERLKTDYIDLYLIHRLGNINHLTRDLKTWVKKTKAAKKIKFFGFSTHHNEQCLDAPKFGWIDGIMFTYNFRLMHDDDTKAAVEACQKAGIGLIAIKTQAVGPVEINYEIEWKLAGHFVRRGFSSEQAKLKAVWENPAIASICCGMADVATLSANAAAAMDKTKLSNRDWKVLKEYADSTCSGYCSGCSAFCESAMDTKTGIADVMRYLMYYKTYKDPIRAREYFAQLPDSVRSKVGKLDYSRAEAACPRKTPISDLMREAKKLLS